MMILLGVIAALAVCSALLLGLIFFVACGMVEEDNRIERLRQLYASACDISEMRRKEIHEQKSKIDELNRNLRTLCETCDGLDEVIDHRECEIEVLKGKLDTAGKMALDNDVAFENANDVINDQDLEIERLKEENATLRDRVDVPQAELAMVKSSKKPLKLAKGK